ncbi:MAG: hypothetical protein HUU44_11980 [Ignavibacteriaceae bacterium]|jgi:hypothetical protein|nr:hypothetical protein [Ignavibacteriaceae bacterium]
MKSKTLLQATLKDVRDLSVELQDNFDSTTRFITNPREFLASRGFLVPLGWSIKYVPTEELRARFQSERLLKQYVKELEETDAKGAWHLVGGRYHCGYIDCIGETKKNEKPIPVENGCSKNIYSELSIQEFYNIVIEASTKKRDMEVLLNNPQLYFEEKGYFSPSPNLVRFNVIHTSEIEKIIKTPEGFKKYFIEDQASIKCHVTGNPVGGKACDWIEIIIPPAS